MKTLNEVYSSLATRRRYEVWFIRLGLADAGGAWWFRYLLMNPGRGGCAVDPCGKPIQVWATWFPRDGKPQSYIQGFGLEGLSVSARGKNPFHFCSGENEIGENACRGTLHIDGHEISWDLQYESSFRATLSDKGWIGFSRSAHSDAVFAGRITIDGRTFEADPLGFGVQGHNCGYRHRGFWTWAHAYFQRPNGLPSTLEALVYDMPLGLVFRKAVLWHDQKQFVFRNLREESAKPGDFSWSFEGKIKRGLLLRATFSGAGWNIHRLPYLKTDCSGTFEVTNNSLATATLRLEGPAQQPEILQTSYGAVLEMAGRR